jgi:SNF2 family DNA or RNA helicase
MTAPITTAIVRAERGDADDIVIISEFRDKDLVKTLPGARWDTVDRVWRAPLAWSTCKALRSIFGDRLMVGDRLRDWAWEHKTTRIDPALALRLEVDEPSIGAWDPRLFPFQRAGVAFLAVVERGLLADEMGTGKTVQAISALRYAHETWGAEVLPLLVVAPNTMKRTWEREIRKWWPDLRVVVLNGNAAQRRKTFEVVQAGGADVLVTHWEILRYHSRLAPFGSIKLTETEKQPKELNMIGWRAVIFDEAHKLKNPQAQQTRAAWAIAHMPSVNYLFALTGTPVANAPHDLWSVLHAIDRREWPSRTRFVDRYCLWSWNTFGGLDVIGVRPDTAEEFYSVVDPKMRRMPKALVLPHLPPKIGGILNDSGPVLRYAQMTSKQTAAYKQMAAGMLAELDSGDTVVATSPIAQLTRLLQFASSYAEIDENGAVRLAAPSSKVDALVEILDEMGSDEPVVVFAHSKQLIMLAGQTLADMGVTHRFLVGDQTERERTQAIDDFQNGQARVILCTLAAGGVGVTLTRARVCVFLQRDFNLVNNVQAEARVHRIGSEQHDSVLIVDVVSEGTVDERVLELIRTKGERLEEVVRDRDTLRALIGGN